MTDQDFILKLREAVDYIDGTLVWKESYRSRKKGRHIGTPHNKGYREARFNGNQLRVDENLNLLWLRREPNQVCPYLSISWDATGQ